ncbi:MBL fold metallo-hydrolase [Pleionea sp. CnH1-48]|uniref:MBL fold metallo-hydrolase n=1 Tax=Pleionea sp. CnH1-48 TaxID=2954494 RepID=UPI002096C11C|nr:MBL fold metallo-hydrolase [Pleionea sp. CnH1-48]MCO7223523.1 MBL fold metallo-hydrolase [Pleionea sp. CnH1-48]
MKFPILIIFIFSSFLSVAHDNKGRAHYLGNEGVMVSQSGVKVLFDPFFHNSYGHYTLVPEKLRQAIFDNKAPYDNVSAIFISHAHGDHFDKNDVLKYLQKNQTVKLFAPAQAVEMIKNLKGYKEVKDRVTAVHLKKGEAPKHFSIKDIDIEVVRIPHAGWPKRAEIENMVFRVKVGGSTVVMHMGDADSDVSHYYEQQFFWPKQTTDMAFPPYWLSLSASGKHVLNKVINAKKIIGVHVPTTVPPDLKASGDDFFSKPGETRDIE